MAWRDVNINLASWERSKPKTFAAKKYKSLGIQTLDSCCKKCKNKTITIVSSAYSKRDIILHKSKDKIERFDFLCSLETIDDLLEEKISLICKNCYAKRKLDVFEFRRIGGKTKI